MYSASTCRHKAHCLTPITRNRDSPLYTRATATTTSPIAGQQPSHFPTPFTTRPHINKHGCQSTTQLPSAGGAREGRERSRCWYGRRVQLDQGQALRVNRGMLVRSRQRRRPVDVRLERHDPRPSSRTSFAYIFGDCMLTPVHTERPREPHLQCFDPLRS